jgi:hypothetical protein
MLDGLPPPGPAGSCQWVVIEPLTGARVRSMRRCGLPAAPGADLCPDHQLARSAFGNFRRQQCRAPDPPPSS